METTFLPESLGKLANIGNVAMQVRVVQLVYRGSLFTCLVFFPRLV